MTRGGNDTRPLDREYIRERVEEGATDREIAVELAANPEAIGRIRRRKLGLPRNYRPSPTPEALALAERLLDDRAPLSEVAETIGVHPSTVAAHFPGRGWTRSESGQHARALASLDARLAHVDLRV